MQSYDHKINPKIRPIWTAPRTVEDFGKNLPLKDLDKKAFWPQNQILGHGAKLTSIWRQNLDFFLFWMKKHVNFKVLKKISQMSKIQH